MNKFFVLPWVKQAPLLQQPSYNSADELYQRIDKLPGGPKWRCTLITLDEAPNEGPFPVYYRDPVECLAYLQANPAFRGNMNYVPVEQYTDTAMTNRVYSEPHTAKWMHEVQADYPEDSINGFFLASDDTHLTNFSGDKKMHPVLISSSHISKSIRAKPSRRAFLLMARIPDCKFANTDFPTAEQRSTMPGILNSMLFHKSMKVVLKSVTKMDEKPVEMADSFGDVRRERCFLAGYIGDLKEHQGICCLNQNDCVKCLAETADLGNAHPCAPRTQKSILDKIHKVRDSLSASASLWDFVKAAKKDRLFGVEHPFWEDLPQTDICKAICTDVLHGLHKSFKDHTATWTTNIVGDYEFDCRMRKLPKFPGFRHFSQGISKISQWSGREHKDLQRVFLVASCGTVHRSITIALRAELDFIYTAQWRSITTEDLNNMKSYNKLYHDHKEIFLTLHGRKTEGFNIPKPHNRPHFIDVIEWLGTTDNYNTETSERYHIDVAKRAWAASNHKDAVIQMLKWLERQEKLYEQDAYLRWIDDNYVEEPDYLEPWGWRERNDEPEPISPQEVDEAEVDIAKYKLTVKPQNAAVTLTEVSSLYKLPDLEQKLSEYLHGSTTPAARLPQGWDLLDIWSSVKVCEPDIVSVDDDSVGTQRLLARLRTKDSAVPCFQTVLVDKAPEDGESREVGISGTLNFICYL